MANPYYVSNHQKRVPDLREKAYGGGGGMRMINPRPEPPGKPPAEGVVGQSVDTKDWLSKYGPTMCDFFKTSGSAVGKDPHFDGEATAAKNKFTAAFEAYEKPNAGSDIRDFAWDCFVQGFDEGRQLVGNGGGGSATDDDGWGFGTWALVLGGVGLVGLFGYNLYTQ